MMRLKQKILSVVLLFSIIILSIDFSAKITKASDIEDRLLMEYASEFTYLGELNTIYHGYVEKTFYPEYDVSFFKYSCKGVFPIEPISYRIDDYDQDGQRELLLVTMDEEYRIKLEMYEVENNQVVLKDSSLFSSREYSDGSVEYIHAGVYWEEDELNCFTYNYKGEKIIAIEAYNFAFISADGMGYDYVMIKYNGNKLSIINESHGEGSDFDEDTIRYTNEEFENMGIILDSSELFDRKKKVSDYVDNKIVFASVRTKSKQNASEIVFNSKEERIDDISDITFEMKNNVCEDCDEDFNMDSCTIRQELDVSDCRQGDVIELAVYLQGDHMSEGLQVSALAGIVEYDTSLFVVEKSDVLPFESGSVSEKSFDQSSGRFGVNYDSDITAYGEEPILRLKLHVNEKATTGKTTICVTHLEWQSGDGEKYEIENWTPSSVVISKSEPTIVLGDVNLDDRVTLADVKYVMKYCNGTKKLNSQQKKNADMNGDGKITLADAKLIMEYCNKILKQG